MKGQKVKDNWEQAHIRRRSDLHGVAVVGTCPTRGRARAAVHKPAQLHHRIVPVCGRDTRLGFSSSAVMACEHKVEYGSLLTFHSAPPRPPHTHLPSAAVLCTPEQAGTTQPHSRTYRYAPWTRAEGAALLWTAPHRGRATAAPAAGNGASTFEGVAKHTNESYAATLAARQRSYRQGGLLVQQFTSACWRSWRSMAHWYLLSSRPNSHATAPSTTSHAAAGAGEVEKVRVRVK